MIKLYDPLLIVITVLILLFVTLLQDARAEYGPYTASYIRNYDGDTVTLSINIWPGVYVINSVRLLGVDTPERKNPKCEKEKSLAINAQVIVEVLLKQAKEIKIYVAKIDGRGRALVYLMYDGKNLTETLLEQGAGVPMGSKRTMDWCAGGPVPAA